MMGGSGSTARSLWPFWGSSSSAAESRTGAQVKRPRMAEPFVYTRRSSLFYDEDGDLAHEFYEEVIVVHNGRRGAELRRVESNLMPQGIVNLDHPRIHVDFPIVICES